MKKRSREIEEVIYLVATAILDHQETVSMADIDYVLNGVRDFFMNTAILRGEKSKMPEEASEPTSET